MNFYRRCSTTGRKEYIKVFDDIMSNTFKKANNNLIEYEKVDIVCSFVNCAEVKISQVIASKDTMNLFKSSLYEEISEEEYNECHDKANKMIMMINDEFI